MRRGAFYWAAGIIAAVLVAGIVALLRSDGPGLLVEVPSETLAVTSIAIVGDGPPPGTAATSTTATTVLGATVGATYATAATADDEPAVEFLEDRLAVEGSGGKSVSVEGGVKGDPVVQAVTVTGATTSTIADEPVIDFEEQSEPLEPKDTTPSTAGVSGARGASGSTREGRMYTYEDGDSTRQVWLEPNLVVKSNAPVGPLQDAVVEIEGVGGTRSDASDAASGWPVFRSRSGSLMTLPGGVLLVLDPEWSEPQTDAFFSSNGIKQSRVSELDYLPNGFYVETEPGFPSLDLANDLAAQDGVELSSPNWWTESSTR